MSRSEFIIVIAAILAMLLAVAWLFTAHPFWFVVAMAIIAVSVAGLLFMARVAKGDPDEHERGGF